MSELWEWHFCEKCNTWTEQDSTTGGFVCRRCKNISQTIVIDLKKQREQKLEFEIADTLSHVGYVGAKHHCQEAFFNTSEEYEKAHFKENLTLAKAIISWVRKSK